MKGCDGVLAPDAVSLLSDTSAIEDACRHVVERSPDEAARFRGGNVKLMGFFVGNVMKETGGKANPKIVNEILRKLLG